MVDRTGEAEGRQREAKPEPAPEAPPDPAKRRRRNLLIALGVAVLAIAAIGYGVYYFLVGRYLISTDDAYLQADNVTVAPQVSGTVVGLHVTDNQRVKRGELMVEIDAATYRARADQARAVAAEARANIDNLDARLTLQQTVIDGSRADLAAARAQAALSHQDLARYRSLAHDGAATVQRVQQAEADARSKDAAVVKAQAALTTQRQQLDVLDTQLAQARAALAANQAQLSGAQTDLGYTRLYAATDGEIGDRNVRLGQYVQAGTALMMVVPVQDTYLVANFKETQIGRMMRGEAVTISVDAFPGATIHGRVDSLAPGSGSQFSLLPPENATGNFTKIVQRVPVKIVIDPDDPYRNRLRPGLSVEATVDLRTAPGGHPQRLAANP